MQHIILLKQLSFWTILNFKLIYSVDIRPRQEDPCFVTLLSGPSILAEESVRQKNSPTWRLDTPASRPCPRPLGHWNLPSNWPKASAGLFSETKGCAVLFNVSSFQIEEYAPGIFTLKSKGSLTAGMDGGWLCRLRCPHMCSWDPSGGGLFRILGGKHSIFHHRVECSLGFIGVHYQVEDIPFYSCFSEKLCLIIKWVLYFVKCFFCITW